MAADMRGNLWRYLVFSAVFFTPAFVPVVVLFWESHGLDLQDVFVLQGLYALAVVVLEVPTGMVADRLGRRTSLMMAAAIYAVAFPFYAFGQGFAWFLLSEVLLALGGALYSGADAALLYDTLEQQGQQATYARWEGRGRAVQMTTFAVSNVIGGLIGAVSLEATLWISGIGPALALLVAWGFVERPAVANLETPRRETLAEGVAAYRKLLLEAVRFVWRHQMVRWYLAYYAVLTGSAMWLLWLYQPYFAFVGLPVWSFGLIFALYNLFGALVSVFAQRIRDVLGERGALLAFAVLQVVPLVGMAVLVTPLSTLFVFGHQAVRALCRPVLNDRVLAYTWADKRATVLSLGSLFGRLFFGVTAPLVGVVAKVLTLPQALGFQAALLSAVLVALAIAYARVPPKYASVKPRA